MPKHKIIRRRPWTKSDLKTLRKQAGHVPSHRIAKELRRSHGAIRQQAFKFGLSLALR